MDVHIHGGRIHVQVDEIGRRASFGNEVFVGLHHGLVQQRAAEIPSVHKEKLVAQRLSGALGFSHIALQIHKGSAGRYVHDVSHNGRSQQVLDADFISESRFHDVDVLAVVGKGEGYVRTGERHPLELLHDMPQLYIVALEELAAGRDVVEEISDRYVGSHRAGNLFGAFILRGRHHHLHTQLLTGLARPERHFRHRHDGSQGLSAEAEGEDVMQVLGR